METKEILLKAADLVDQGWCQKDYAQDEDGKEPKVSGKPAVRWCAVGACHEVEPDFQTASKAVNALKDYLEQTCWCKGYGVSAWNDVLDRQQKEVSAALRATADLCK